LSAEAAGQYDRSARLLDNLPADPPVVRDAERPDLPVVRPVAFYQQIVGDSLVGPRDVDALGFHHRHPAHHWDARNCALDLEDMLRRNQLRGGPQMDD
jgi:hypothetical protein